MKRFARLPERLRAPIVLCYLEGLTYAAAAHQVGLSERTIRGRLALARARLRRRLTWRGVTVPAGLLTVGAGVKADAGITVSLVDSTVRVALGFVSGNKAADLARGVLSSLLLNQLRAAAALVCLALGAGYGAWQAIAAGGDGRGQVRSGPARAGVTASIPAALTDHYGDPLPSGAALRLGTVRFRQLGFIRHIAYSPTSELVVTDSSENYLWVWDARDGRKLRQIEPVLNPIGGFAFSPDGKLIASGWTRFRARRGWHPFSTGVPRRRYGARAAPGGTGSPR